MRTVDIYLYYNYNKLLTFTNITYNLINIFLNYSNIYNIFYEILTVLIVIFKNNNK